MGLCFITILFFFRSSIKKKINIVGSVGYFSDLQTSLALKTFFNFLGCSNILYNIKTIEWVYDFKQFFSLNILIGQLELIKFFLFINCDLRLESPLLNVRLKKNYMVNKNNELFLYSYGLSLNYLTYPIKNIGNTVLKFISFLEGKQRFACDFFFKYFYTVSYFDNNTYNFYNNSIFFLGNSIIFRNDSKSFFYSVFMFLKKQFSFASFNLVNSYLGFYSYVNLLINNKNKVSNKNKSLYYLLSVDNIKMLNKDSFLVYQSFVKNALYSSANLIFSSTAFYEFDSIYINLEGKYRVIKQVLKSFENIYTDWEIISLLNIFNKKKRLIQLTYFFYFYKIIKYFTSIIDYNCNFFLSMKYFIIELFYHIGLYLHTKNNIYDVNLEVNKKIKYKFINNFFNSYINNYYISDFYTKNSKTMSFSALTKYKIFKLN